MTTPTPPTGMPHVRLRPVTVGRAAAAAIAVVVAVNLVAIAIAPWEGEGLATGTAEWLLLANENNPSTWLSSVLVLAVAVVLLWCGAVDRASRWWWWMLGAVAAGLSLDESASLHEKLDDYLDVGDAVGGSGLLNYAWIIPGTVLVLVATLVFGRFVLSLPRATRFGIMAAAATFLLGAVVVEAVAGWWDDRHGFANTGYHLITTVEETLEMAGALCALLVLLVHARRLGPAVLEVSPAVRAADGDETARRPASGATGTPTAPAPTRPPAEAGAPAGPAGAS